MSDIKWIKITTNIFDNEKIRIIESMPEGDSIIVIWFKILVLAGNINDNGFVYFTRDIPYTDQMMATLFNRPLSTIQMALSTFEKFGMIEIIDDLIHVSNWERYQNVDGMEKIREQTRLRVAKCREKKKLECNATSNATVTQCNDIDKEEDKDIDKDNNPPKSPLKKDEWQEQMLNERDLSDNLKAAIVEYLQYKKERKEKYQPKGFKAFLNKLENNVTTYGEQAVIDLIFECMSRNYQGIIYEMLEKRPKKNDQFDFDAYLAKRGSV